jgi:hypothetical protein
LLLAATAPAQNYAVTPGYAASAECSTWGSLPFYSPWGYCRYQQVTDDLRGTQRVFTEIAWRRDGLVVDSFRMGPHRVEMEMHCADADKATFNATFDTNYASPRIPVFTRRVVVTPDHTWQPPMLPAPWTFLVPFDVPFPYSGQKDLLYEVTCHSFSDPQDCALDVAIGRVPSSIGASEPVGTGCTTRFGVMTLRSKLTLDAATSRLDFIWNIQRGPGAGIAAILVGTHDPNTPVAGLCGDGRLHTDVLFTVSISNTLNVEVPGGWVMPYDPRWSTVTFTSQVVTTDWSQPGLPVAVSNGVRSPVPMLPTATPFHYVVTQVPAPTGRVDTDRGLATRLRY